MTGRSSADNLLRRTRIAGWSAAGAASIATIGLIAGVGQAGATVATTTSPTTTTTPATSTGTSTTGTGTSNTGTGTTAGNVSTPDQGSQPQGGSNGS